MDRFMGLMPCDEVEKYRTFKDSNGFLISIEAGPKGWSIIWADQSVDYADVNDTTENNFNKAYKVAEQAVGSLYSLSKFYQINQLNKGAKI